MAQSGRLPIIEEVHRVRTPPTRPGWRRRLRVRFRNLTRPWWCFSTSASTSPYTQPVCDFRRQPPRLPRANLRRRLDRECLRQSSGRRREMLSSWLRPRSLTVRVPALGKRPSASQRCLSLVLIVRMSSISRGITGRVSMFTNALTTTADAAWNSAFSLAGIISVSSRPSRLSDFFVACGSRARISRRMPFMRTDEPNVAAGGSTHVLSSSMWFLSCFGMTPRWVASFGSSMTSCCGDRASSRVKPKNVVSASQPAITGM